MMLRLVCLVTMGSFLYGQGAVLKEGTPMPSSVGADTLHERGSGGAELRREAQNYSQHLDGFEGANAITSCAPRLAERKAVLQSIRGSPSGHQVIIGRPHVAAQLKSDTEDKSEVSGKDCFTLIPAVEARQRRPIHGLGYQPKATQLLKDLAQARANGPSALTAPHRLENPSTTY